MLTFAAFVQVIGCPLGNHKGGEARVGERKRQHTIPRCYLKAWCDPHTPPGQHPFVWRISRDGSSKKRRSPEKSFTETDRYTIRLPNGDRNLVLEDSLARIEDNFTRVLTRVRRRDNLSDVDRANLILFTAAMHTRSKPMGDYWKGKFQEIHDLMASMEKAHDAPATTSLESGMFAEHAHQISIAILMKEEAPLLAQMQLSIMVTDDELGFITSDAPCVWFNPELRKLPPLYRSPGLAQPDVEVTLPLTPHHMIFISHKNFPFYIDVRQPFVDEANRVVRFHCESEFVSWKGETRPIWFDRGKMPDDAWEKMEERKKTK